TIATQELMETHIKNEFKHGFQDIPPFNTPMPHIFEPDIVFYVKINGDFHPYFEQLKIRKVLKSSDVEKALAVISSHAMQEKMDKEQEKMQKDKKKHHKNCGNRIRQQVSSLINSNHQRLQEICPTGTYI
ncbi:hypothetical protein BGZ93_000345, partial [Podila epicladia]